MGKLVRKEFGNVGDPTCLRGLSATARRACHTSEGGGSIGRRDYLKVVRTLAMLRRRMLRQGLKRR